MQYKGCIGLRMIRLPGRSEGEIRLRTGCRAWTYVCVCQFGKDFIKITHEFHYLSRYLGEWSVCYEVNEEDSETSVSSVIYLSVLPYEKPVPTGWSTAIHSECKHRLAVEMTDCKRRLRTLPSHLQSATTLRFRPFSTDRPPSSVHQSCCTRDHH